MCIYVWSKNCWNLVYYLESFVRISRKIFFFTSFKRREKENLGKTGTGSKSTEITGENY